MVNLMHGGDIYAVANRHGWDWREITDFSASINPLGPSPLVIPAIRAALGRIVHYPEPGAATLRSALAAHWRIEPENLIAGNGATELIHSFARYLAPDRVSLAAPVFSEFHRAFPAASVMPFDSAHWPADGLVVVSRPANPTGSLPMIDGYLAATTNPILVDESFIEFCDTPSLLNRIENRGNLFVLRSLTKFHAIPGLRAGVLAGPRAVMERWAKVREPWQVNVLAEAAVLASLQDFEHAGRTREFVKTEREWLVSQLAHLHPQPSSANYLLLSLDEPAARVAEALERRKILVRDCSNWPGVPFTNAIRIAIRTRAENQKLIAALRGVLCQS